MFRATVFDDSSSWNKQVEECCQVLRAFVGYWCSPLACLGLYPVDGGRHHIFLPDFHKDSLPGIVRASWYTIAQRETKWSKHARVLWVGLPKRPSKEYQILYKFLHLHRSGRHHGEPAGVPEEHAPHDNAATKASLPIRVGIKRRKLWFRVQFSVGIKFRWKREKAKEEKEEVGRERNQVEKALLDATHRRQLCSDQLPSWTLLRVHVYNQNLAVGACWIQDFNYRSNEGRTSRKKFGFSWQIYTAQVLYLLPSFVSAQEFVTLPVCMLVCYSIDIFPSNATKLQALCA